MQRLNISCTCMLLLALGHGKRERTVGGDEAPVSQTHAVRCSSSSSEASEHWQQEPGKRQTAPLQKAKMGARMYTTTT